MIRFRYVALLAAALIASASAQINGGINGGVAQIVAGTNVTVSPSTGIGAVTVNSTGGGGTNIFGNIAFSGAQTSTQSYLWAPGTTLSGSVTAPASGQVGLQEFYILSDTVDASSAGLNDVMVFERPDVGYKGGRNGIFSEVFVVGAPATSTSGGPMVAGQFLGNMGANQGGTSGYANAIGSVWGVTAGAIQNSQYGAQSVSAELDQTVLAPTGNKYGLLVVQAAGDTTRGTYDDAAIGINSQAASDTWLRGISFGSYDQQWPFGTDSTLIGAMQRQTPSTNSPVALYGVDFSAVTFQSGGCSFKSTGFCIDPSGNITAVAAATSGAITTTLTGQTANTTVVGHSLLNNTAASASNQQEMCEQLTGQGWGTTAPASYEADWKICNVPVQGTSLPTDFISFYTQINGGGYTSVASLSNLGVFTSASLASLGSVTLGSTASLNFTSRGILTSPAAGQIQFGAANAASPVAQTVLFQGSSGSNAAGANTIIQGSLGTGNAAGATLALQTAHAGSSSSTQQTANTQILLGDNTVGLPNVTTGAGSGYLCYGTSNTVTTSTTPCGTVTNITLLQSGIPFVMGPSDYMQNNGVVIVGLTPLSSATATFSATSGTGVTLTMSATGWLAGSSADIGRVLTILDTTYKYFTITGNSGSSTTVCQGTISGGTLSGTGPFANNVIWGTNPGTGSATYPTPLPRVMANSYAYFPSGAISSGSAAGWYWTSWASTTVGTVYNNTYTSGTPVVVASPTAFSTTGPGAFTQTTNTYIQGRNGTLVGNTMGLNGSLENSTFFATPNNGNNKLVRAFIGTVATRYGQLNGLSVITTGGLISLTNQGATGAQVYTTGNGGSGGDFAQGSGADTTLAVDTTANQTVGEALELTAATDYIISDKLAIRLFPTSP